MITEYDSTARTVTTRDATTGAIVSTRPFTTAENAAADAAEADAIERAAAEAKAAEDRAILDATAEAMSKAHTDGQPWVQPTGAHDAYGLGAKVAHKGQTWTSIAAANVWEPGVYGWSTP